LTSGVTGRGEFPYSSVLSKRLGPKAEVRNEGYGGELATDLPARLNRLLSAAALQPRGRFDAVVILGGTNDLRMGASAAEVVAAILLCLEAAVQHGAAALACTVPEMRTEAIAGGRGARIREQRLCVNQQLQEAMAAHPGACSCVDLAAQCPMSELPEELRAELWADDVHPTAKGYQAIGALVADALLVQLESGQGSQGRPRPRYSMTRRAVSMPSRTNGRLQPTGEDRDEPSGRGRLRGR